MQSDKKQTMKRQKRIPDTPGIYIFHNKQKTPLYIGKAGNLKKRLASYWRKNVGQKTKLLLQEATHLELKKTGSEIEALIREAELIKKYRPKYNILMRDDKNYFYVGITKETFPKIFITHQPQQKGLGTSRQELVTKKQKLTANPYPLVPNYIGPFTSGSALKTTLKLLRHIFPYCTCNKLHKRPCLNAEIGKCPGYCCTATNHQQPTTNDQNEYKKNVKNIIAVLRGKKQRLLTELQKAMREASQKQDYEKAAKLRNQITGLKDVFAHKKVLELPRAISNWPALQKKLHVLVGTAKPIERIEGYDISNISGTEAGGSMVVFTNGKPDKKEYRIFKIKTVRGANDVAMIKEVIRRRMRHSEWQFPNMIVIDGGKPQLNAALSQLTTHNLQPSTIITALAKQEEELYIERREKPVPLKLLDRDVLHLFQAVRDEAHRFAKKYHHKLRETGLKK